MRARTPALVLITAALLTTISSAPTHASSDKAGRVTCAGLSCTFYFSTRTTAAMKRAAGRSDWLAGPTSDIICLRIPNRFVALACAGALLLPYDKAKSRLSEASAMGGCHCRRGWTRARRGTRRTNGCAARARSSSTRGRRCAPAGGRSPPARARIAGWRRSVRPTPTCSSGGTP
ncbi:hypothetical protein [Streptosporangium sp. NPDC002721]|uniref:hypothetical protein n=1 Tax=Streptosporangium sp. NPDC002721 TaxID=3366188 RepID=UPI0036B56778